MTRATHTIDRRSLLKVMGSAGASAALVSAGRLPGLVLPEVRAYLRVQGESLLDALRADARFLAWLAS